MDYLWTPWRYAYVSGTDKPSARRGVPLELEAWPGDKGCVFCNLNASSVYAAEHGMPVEEADRAAHIVYRAEHCFVCLNAFPYSSGHVMVIPFEHQHSLALLDAAASIEMMQLARQTETVLEKVYQPHGINMGINLGKAAGAGVADHLHLHILPRWVGDTNFMTVISETRVLPESLDETWRRLRDAFLHP
jgi:ATP adenylyltransferase